LVVVLIIAGLPLTASSGIASKVGPAKVESIPGTDVKRVVLTEKAAERLGIKTTPVRDAQVSKKRMVVGEVVALPAAEAAGRSAVRVRVPLSRGQLKKVAHGQPASVLPLARGGDDEERAGLTAQPVETPAGDGPKEPTAALYYVVDSPENSLVAGQRVRVRVSLSGKGKKRKVVPYAAVLYDLHGETWVYTNPEPLVFVRHKVDVDYVEGDVAVLEGGPSSGTAVVTVGASLLLGTELGFGK